MQETHVAVSASRSNEARMTTTKKPRKADPAKDQNEIIQQVMDAFVQQLRDDPTIDDETCDRLAALHQAGKLKKPKEIERALRGE